MMRTTICILGISIILTSCASLTQTQIESVNQFALTTKDFSAFPSKIIVELANIRFKRGIYYANSLSDPKRHIGELDSIFSQREFDYRVSEKVDITFRILDTYAQSLALLSCDKYEKDILKQSKNFGIDLDSLISLNNSIKNSTKIPTGIGGAVNRLIILGGKQYVKAKQAKEIKKFVSLGDTLVSTMTFNLIEFLQSKNINELIVGEEREITRDYLSFLQQTTRATIENERDYLELKKNITAVKLLRQQTIEATKSLRATHKKLQQDLKKKRTLKQSVKELQVLYEEIKSLKETVQKIETSK